MTKNHVFYAPRPEQLSLPFAQAPSFQLPTGSLRRTESVLEAYSETLKDCRIERDIIAKEMSRLLGENVTISHINNWAAESKSNYRMPLEWSAAFCLVTNDYRVIKAAFRESGINILDDTEMVFYEIGKYEEEKRDRAAKLKEQRNKLKALRMQGKV